MKRPTRWRSSKQKIGFLAADASVPCSKDNDATEDLGFIPIRSGLELTGVSCRSWSWVFQLANREL